MCSSWRVNAAKGGSCPPSWLKKAASRAENMADAKKLQDACKLAENGSASHTRKKLLKKQAIARVRMGRSCLARVSRQPLFGIRCGNGSFCLPLFWGGGVQDGLCHIHLNGEGPKKFRQQQGDWRAKLLESQRRVLGRQGRVGQDLAADHGRNGAGAAPTPK